MRRITKNLYMNWPYLFAVKNFAVDHVEADNSFCMIHGFIVTTTFVNFVDS
jgi:hypothetical protein